MYNLLESLQLGHRYLADLSRLEVLLQHDHLILVLKYNLYEFQLLDRQNPDEMLSQAELERLFHLILGEMSNHRGF
jgi:hypothetical protein